MAQEIKGSEMAGQGHDIIIIKRANDLPEQIQERLHAEGYSTVAVPDLRDIHRKIERLKDPLVIIESGNGNDADVAFFKTLLSTEVLFTRGVILVGKSAKSYQAALSKVFALAMAVPTPGSPAQIIQTLRDVTDMLPRMKDELLHRQSKPTIAPVIPIDRERKERERREPLSAPDSFFEQVQNLSLGDVKIGGAKYTSNIDRNLLLRNEFYPTDSKVKLAVERICEDAGKWGRNHLYRICYVTNCLAVALNFTEDLRRAVQEGAFLWAWSFAGDREDLLRKVYIKENFTALRRDLSSKIKDSALSVSSEINDPLLTNSLAKFAKIVANEERVGDDSVSIVASTIMGADLVDRICFHTSYWDSRAAYNLLKKFKTSQIDFLHPAVLCCLIKLLSETIASNPSAVLIPKKLRTNPELLEKARRAREEEPEEHETRVEIAELTPGMKLSKPLYAFDGRQILEEDLTLDQDLVWRIWQLSAIRPLNAPLIVQKKK